MASGGSQSQGQQHWVASRPLYDRTIFDKYDKVFKLLDGWKGIENGGSIDRYSMLFTVEEKALNIQKMEDAWGKKWRESFGKNTDDGGSTVFYYLTEEAMQKLNGRQAAFLIQNLAISLESHSPDCWGDMLLEVVVVVLVTWGSSGWGTPNAIAIFTAAVSIGTIVTRTQLPPTVQFAIIVVSLANAYQAAGSQITGKLALSALFDLNTLATQVASAHEVKSTQAKLEEIKNKTMELKDLMDADSFEQQMIFTYDTEFSVSARSIETDPYHNIMVGLDEQSVYASYWERNNDTWHQEA